MTRSFMTIVLMLTFTLVNFSVGRAQSPPARFDQATRYDRWDDADGLVNKLKSMADDDPNRATAIDELKKELESEFEQRHAAQLADLGRMETKLKSLRATHDERLQHKDLIIQRRLNQLIGKGDMLGWAGPSRATVETAPVLRQGYAARGVYDRPTADFGSQNRDWAPSPVHTTKLDLYEGSRLRPESEQNRFAHFETLSQQIFDVSANLVELKSKKALSKRELAETEKQHQQGLTSKVELVRIRSEAERTASQLELRRSEFDRIENTIQMYESQASGKGDELQRVKLLREAYNEAKERLDRDAFPAQEANDRESDE